MKAFYLKPSNSSFVRTDEKILAGHFDLTARLITSFPKKKYLLKIIRLVIFLLFRGRRFDFYFTRFADYHTFFLTLFSRIYDIPLFIVIGGFEVASIPEFGYGGYSNVVRSFCIKYALRHATYLLPNSKELINNTNYFDDPAGREGGILHFVPETNAKIHVISNGFDPEFWTVDPSVKRIRSVIAVAITSNLTTMKIKGVDSYINVAAQLTDIPFTLVGATTEFLSETGIKLPPNLRVIKTVPKEELRKLYQQAGVFCIFSITEGMPNALCEAMLCGCTPVGSRVNSIPEIIGNTGYVAAKNDITFLAEIVGKALNRDNLFNESARKRILTNYSLEKREQSLVNLINQKLKKQ